VGDAYVVGVGGGGGQRRVGSSGAERWGWGLGGVDGCWRDVSQGATGVVRSVICDLIPEFSFSVFFVPEFKRPLS
jgi:hypothetical protein